MDIGQTFLIFAFEAVVFIAILTACLHFAAKRHRNHLKDVINQLNQSKLFKAEQEVEQKRSKELLNKLKDKLARLQQQITMLERIEKKYYALKDKYDRDIGELRGRLTDGSPIDDRDDSNKHVIKVGTTADNASGVDPAYLSYLARRSSIADAGEYTQRVSHESNSLNKKLQKQRDIIQSLQKELREAHLASEVEAIKGSEKEAALTALQHLEDSLNVSQSNGRELEASLSKLKRELSAANDKVATMEMKMAQSRDNKNQGDNTDITFNVRYSDQHQADEMDALDRDMEVALRDYKKVKQEVELLRNNTGQQRQLIFVLEKEILELRNALEDSSLSQEEQEQRQAQIKRLENLLRETEGCVVVLESEVSYLQEKLVNYGKADKVTSLEEMYQQANKKLQRTLGMLERAKEVRTTLSDIIVLGRKSNPKAALEQITKMLMQLFDKFDVAVHIQLVTQFGEINAANRKGFDKSQVRHLAMSIRNNPYSILEAEDGFIVCLNYIGGYVKAPLNAETSLGRLKETLHFILQISNAVVTHLEEKRSAYLRQSALRRLVEAVRKKVSTISVQSRYQTDEARKIFDSLVTELNSMLLTMNMSKNQSEFFTQMIDETRQRMSLLLESDSIMDKSFTELLERIENSAPPPTSNGNDESSAVRH